MPRAILLNFVNPSVVYCILYDMTFSIWQMNNNYQIEDPEFKKLVSGSITVPACVATAGTTLIIGFVNFSSVAVTLFLLCFVLFFLPYTQLVNYK